MTTKHTHRDIFPQTDHGYTWIETIWFSRDGERCSPFIPAAGCTERLGHMPGGPLLTDPWAEEKHYCGGKAGRVLKTETTHAGYHHVGTCFITPT